MKLSSFLFALLCLIFIGDRVLAQAGMTVSPGKLYYKSPSGSSSSQTITVSNPNNKEIEVGVSVGDWDYDSFGNNRTFDGGTLKSSCANWVRVLPGSFFTLKPGEKRELNVVLSVPPNDTSSTSVHTAMLFLTQLNPGDSRTADGNFIKVSVRMGIKLYHSFSVAEQRDIEILDFKEIITDSKNALSGFLELKVRNTGNIWLEGKIKWELLNTRTGEKQKLDDQESYSLPGDVRIIRQELPKNLKKGLYTATAIINYGDKDELKVVELEFEHR